MIPNWHPLFVHFTLALLLTATILFIAGKFLRPWLRTSCWMVARWNLWLGVAFTVGTLLAGWYAFDTVAHDAHSHEPMLSHRLWALTAAGAYAVLAIWSYAERFRYEPRSLFLLCMVLASMALIVAGYKGSELVYRHGLGVMSMPETDGHHHSDDEE